MTVRASKQGSGASKYWIGNSKYWVRVLGMLSLLGQVFACAPQSEDEVSAALEVAIEFHARTPLGEPLSAVLLELSGAAKGKFESDEQGRSEVRVQAGEGDITLQASCPEGYVGEPMKRRLPRALLAQIGKTDSAWVLDLVCQLEQPEMTLSVLSEDCGELRLELEGQKLGSTREGAFQEILPRPQGETAELRLMPEDASCQLADDSFLLSLGSAEHEFFVHALGKKKRRVLRRRSREAPVKKRPYRL